MDSFYSTLTPQEALKLLNAFDMQAGKNTILLGTRLMQK